MDDWSACGHATYVMWGVLLFLRCVFCEDRRAARCYSCVSVGTKGAQQEGGRGGTQQQFQTTPHRPEAGNRAFQSAPTPRRALRVGDMQHCGIFEIQGETDRDKRPPPTACRGSAGPYGSDSGTFSFFFSCTTGPLPAGQAEMTWVACVVYFLSATIFEQCMQGHGVCGGEGERDRERSEHLGSVQSL